MSVLLLILTNKLNQNIEKSMMTRILSTESEQSTEFATELKESTEFTKILNWIVQSINKSTEWLANTDMICHIINSSDYFVNLTSCSCHVSVMNDEFILDILINDVWLTFSLSDDTEKQTLFKNVLYYRKAFCNLFSIDCTVFNDVEFKINKKSINFINKNDNFINWADFKNCYFYLCVNKLTSSISINLVFVTKI